MAKNRIWICEGKIHRMKRWQPVFECFYHTRRAALADLPQSYTSAGRKVEYRVQCYYAKEEHGKE